MFAAAERTDPTGSRLTQLASVGTLLAGRQGANARADPRLSLWWAGTMNWLTDSRASRPLLNWRQDVFVREASGCSVPRSSESQAQNTPQKGEGSQQIGAKQNRGGLREAGQVEWYRPGRPVEINARLEERDGGFLSRFLFGTAPELQRFSRWPPSQRP